jgi:glutathione peroxidase-family protein
MHERNKMIWFENINYLFWLRWSGLEILGFPCNQFLRKEPGTSQEAQDFACDRYKAEYPILGKVYI